MGEIFIATRRKPQGIRVYSENFQCRCGENLSIKLFLEEGAEGLAGTVVCTFLVHAESVPCGGTEDFLLGNIVHTNGNAEH